MERTSAGDILGATFRFVGAHKQAIVVWSAVYLAVSVGLQLAMRPILQMQLGAIQGGAAGIAHALPQGLGTAFLIFVLLMAMLVILNAAVFRAALYPEHRETTYLRLDGDELRLFGLLLFLGIGFYVALIVAFILLTMLTVGAAMLGMVGKLIAVLLSIVGTLGLIGAVIFLVVRLASAGPLTILRKRITIGEAWRLTRGHFWTLFGAYAVVAIVFIVVVMVLSQIMMGSMMQQAMAQQILHPGDPFARQQLLEMQISQYANFGPARWLPLAIGALLGGFLVALQCGSIATATRLLLAESDVAGVF